MSSSRPTFDPVDTSFDATAHAVRDSKDDVESPSLSNKCALARYEISNTTVPQASQQQQQGSNVRTDGTKILLVEWTEDSSSREVSGDWEISWQGKRTVLPAREDPATDGEEPVNRLYFLLGAGVPVPTAVTLQKGTSITWKTNPLPAIFSPELGATARQAGKKGVLHTIWAKKRLQVLQREIELELRNNVEGIGLEMATAEKSWIEDNFGVQARPGGIGSLQDPSMADATSPTSPRSPGGSRLSEKLRGLGLNTTPSGLSTSRDHDSGPPKGAYQNPLSPETSDVAMGSFGSFAAIKGMPPPSSMGAKPAQAPAAAQRRMAAQRPPESVTARQQAGSRDGEMGSLNAFAASGNRTFAPPPPKDDEEDDLFALPMSPRSPETTRGAFATVR